MPWFGALCPGLASLKISRNSTESASNFVAVDGTVAQTVCATFEKLGLSNVGVTWEVPSLSVVRNGACRFLGRGIGVGVYVSGSFVKPSTLLSDES